MEKRLDKEKLEAGLQANRLHVTVLRAELQADQRKLDELEKKIALNRHAVVVIESKINELEPKLAILRRDRSSMKKK